MPSESDHEACQLEVSRLRNGLRDLAHFHHDTTHSPLIKFELCQRVSCMDAKAVLRG